MTWTPLPGTHFSWFLLIVFLPAVGYALARAAQPAFGVGAKLAVAGLASALGASWLFAWPLHVPALALASLPAVGAAVAAPRGPVQISVQALAWCAGFVAPGLLWSLAGPREAAALGLLAILALAAARGVIEPAVDVWRRWRAKP